MDDRQFRRLLHHLGLSWSGYRKVRKGVKKRIARHMLALKCSNMSEYLIELDRSRDVREECDHLMTVSISRFFRDKRMWEFLSGEILPELIEEYHEKISVWSAGCASGEEVYSLKILLGPLFSTSGPSPELNITATDMNPFYLERAMTGFYPASSLKEIPQGLRSYYFHTEERSESYRIKDSLREGITWQKLDLLSGTLDTQFQLIFLRNNLLTYYQDEIKREALKKVLTSLYPGGFLIIGSHETLPIEIPELYQHGPLSYIFRKRG